MSKTGRRVARKPAPIRPARAPVYLKKDELSRVDELRINIVASRETPRPDVASTLELMYLRILGRVKNRSQLDGELKELKQLLDQVSAKMTEIMDKSEAPAGRGSDSA